MLFEGIKTRPDAIEATALNIRSTVKRLNAAAAVALMSSPPRRDPHKTTGKLKKSPTITPKRFGRFFTPRTSLEKGTRFAVSRLILGNATNRGKRQRHPLGREASRDQASDGLSGCTDVPKTKKRKLLCTPESTPEKQSPSKRARNASQSVAAEAAAEDGHSSLDEVAHDTSADEDSSDDEQREPSIRPKSIVRSSCRRAMGAILRRELDMSRNAYDHSRFSCAADWRCETANFYSHPDDVARIHSAGAPSSSRPSTLPFCTTSCNTNTLVAVGDEEGCIRMLDSKKDKGSGFRKTYLSFRPHANAVIALAFSSDDLLLATASGDQSSRIIDMPTQRSIYTLAGHTASVKQVQFQPESCNNIVATCGRDGSVQIWDLRCKGTDGPREFKTVSLEGIGENHSNHPAPRIYGTWAQPVNSIYDAHATRSQHGAVVPTDLKYLQRSESPFKGEPELGGHYGSRRDVSITSLVFLPGSRSNLLITGSDNNASVKLWDLRRTYNLRRGQATPVSTTRQPESHIRGRQYGLNSIALSGDAGRLFTLCRDNNIYVYSTSHLILGSAPELDAKPRPQTARRSGGSGKEGLGPLYAFRHPELRTSSFYVKLAIRPANADHSELLAVGSSSRCAIAFPTDERYLSKPGLSEWERVQMGEVESASLPEPEATPLPTPTSTPTLAPTRRSESMPTYSHGSCLIRGHSSEVTSICWNSEGELVTLSDDCRARVWRENAEAARELRLSGTLEGRRWNSPDWEVGWAEADPVWDDEERDARWS